MASKQAAPRKGARVRARSKIYRPQGGRGYLPITIRPGQEGGVVTTDDRTITVLFDEPPGNVIQWTGKDRVAEFWAAVSEVDPETSQDLRDRLANAF